MRLLVSVASAADAQNALAGGADVIDAKDPTAGPLGAVAPDTLREINAVVARSRALTAALGEAADEGDVERAARDAVAAGAALVKVGFGGVTSRARAARLAAAAVRGASQGGGERGGVILVAYADATQAGGPGADGLLELAADAGAQGVLVDTALKAGPGLLALVAAEELARWVGEAREAGLLVALAGKLTAADLPLVRTLGPDVVGVRGAACDGGRGGRVAAARVRALRALCAPADDAEGVGAALRPLAAAQQ